MQVEYQVRPSKWGHGMFAAAPIRKGQLVWDIHRSAAKIYTEDEAIEKVTQLELAGREVIQSLLEYSYWDSCSKNLVDVTEDDGRFFNHSNEVGQAALTSRRRRLR